MSHDLCVYVTLQQGQIQVLSQRLVHQGEGHEGGVDSAGLTNHAAAAQEGHSLHGTLQEAGGGSGGVGEKTRGRRMLIFFLSNDGKHLHTNPRLNPSPPHPGIFGPNTPITFNVASWQKHQLATDKRAQNVHHLTPTSVSPLTSVNDSSDSVVTHLTSPWGLIF